MITLILFICTQFLIVRTVLSPEMNSLCFSNTAQKETERESEKEGESCWLFRMNCVPIQIEIFQFSADHHDEPPKIPKTCRKEHSKWTSEIA